MIDEEIDDLKAQMNALTPFEQAEIFMRVLWRWAVRYVVRRRAWVVVDDYPAVHLLG